MKRRQSIKFWSFTICVVATCAAAYAWRAGWIPVEFADAQTGILLQVPVPDSPPEATSNAEASAEAQSEELGEIFLEQAEPVPTAGASGAAMEKPPAGTHQSKPFLRVDEMESTSAGRTSDGPDSRGPSPFGDSPPGARAAQRAARPDAETSVGDAAPADFVTGEARSAVETPNPAQLSEADIAVLAQIDTWLEKGNDLQAHRELSQLYWKRRDLRETIRERIERTAHAIYSAPQPHYLKPYEVQPGDQLRLIARRYEVPWEYLAGLNRIDPRKIRPGQKLKVIKGPFGAVVDLGDFALTVHAHGYFVRRYPVGIGRDGASPIGKFRVQEKLVNPTYYGPDGVIAADNPDNPLGERWIGIGDSYGIHGTIEPDSIGRAESRGCIRMHAEHVAEVYDLLSVGSEVLIRR